MSLLPTSAASQTRLSPDFRLFLFSKQVSWASSGTFRIQRWLWNAELKFMHVGVRKTFSSKSSRCFFLLFFGGNEQQRAQNESLSGSVCETIYKTKFSGWQHKQRWQAKLKGVSIYFEALDYKVSRGTNNEKRFNIRWCNWSSAKWEGTYSRMDWHLEMRNQKTKTNEMSVRDWTQLHTSSHRMTTQRSRMIEFNRRTFPSVPTISTRKHK